MQVQLHIVRQWFRRKTYEDEKVTFGHTLGIGTSMEVIREADVIDVIICMELLLPEIIIIFALIG